MVTSRTLILMSAEAPVLSVDQGTVRRVLAGNTADFEVIMRRYNQRMFRVARSILKDDAEAEDAVQQAYLSAYQNLGSFRGDAQLSTWLTRIAVNEALRRRRKSGGPVVLSVVEEVPDKLDHRPTPEERASQGQLRQLLESAIDLLSESNRTVFVMREVEGLSTKEVGECLDLSEEAVRVRLHRARASLRSWLIEQVDTRAADAFSFAGDRCDRIVNGVLAHLLMR